MNMQKGSRRIKEIWGHRHKWMEELTWEKIPTTLYRTNEEYQTEAVVNRTNPVVKLPSKKKAKGYQELG